MDQFRVTLKVRQPSPLVELSLIQEANAPCAAEVLARAKARKLIPGLDLDATLSIVLL